MSKINKQALRESAEGIIDILESIAGFETSDIDGDTVELRFETEDGFDAGCEVSIVDQFQKAADMIRALLDELEAANKAAESGIEWMKRCLAAENRIAELEERQNLKPCPKCNDTGMTDSGGTQPWGEPIEIECDCRQQDANTAELVAAGIINKVGE